MDPEWFDLVLVISDEKDRHFGGRDMRKSWNGKDKRYNRESRGMRHAIDEGVPKYKQCAHI